MATEVSRVGDSMRTYTGVRFYPSDPRPDEIFIQDIAHSLSNMCRFAGHVKEFYSVAEHSVRVSLACHPDDALWGLLHDASEAYVVDMPRPIKRAPFMHGYRLLEAKVSLAVCERFELPLDQPSSVTLADDILLATEARDLMCWDIDQWAPMPEPLQEVIKPLSPVEAKRWFIYRFDELTGNL